MQKIFRRYKKSKINNQSNLCRAIVEMYKIKILIIIMKIKLKMPIAQLRLILSIIL